ncbi:hypothetical protein [Mobilicoccus caccae]|uniref:Uncharacterized protein n=1 Tax=Mobilicoccus caccae TaxID=1859295 RepID=A0ABQ6IWR2_9MICO|nr:hypothetical protein [Mobilicoccus caccae]GMA41929.1 hypothetical protein GCM10025883_39740 [Mobilicoccus caccae]
MDFQDLVGDRTVRQRLRFDERVAASAVRVVEESDAVSAALTLAASLAPVSRLLGRDTATYFSTLVTLGAIDLTTARVCEPHLDALTILAQAGDLDLSPLGAGVGSTWGCTPPTPPAMGSPLAPRPTGPGPSRAARPGALWPSP